MAARHLSLANLVAAAPAIASSLAKSALVIAAGWVASRIAGPAIGSFVLLAGSFAIMVPTFKREWRLGWITCLLPPLCAGVSHGVQLALMDGANVTPPEEWILPVVVLGLGLGWLRGRTHTVMARAGSVFAQRTTGYLLLWVACFAITQVFALARQRDLMEFALLGGTFSTAMLLAVAIVLLRKRGRAVAVGASAAAVVIAIASTGTSGVAAQGDLCGLIPQWDGQRFQQAPLNDSRGNPTGLIFCPSHAVDRPVRSLHVAWGESDAIVQQASATFRAQSEAATQSVALGDEAWETAIDLRTNLRVWSRMVRVGNYLVVTNAAQEAIAQMVPLEAELIRNVQRLRGVESFDAPSSLAMPTREDLWTDVLLPLGAISFLDDFGNDRASLAAVEATAIAAIALILTCVGLTVSESITDVVSRATIDPLKEEKTFIDPVDMLGPPLVDWDGEVVPVQDGSGTYLGGEIGQVWYDGQWMDRAVADRLVQQRIGERQAELAARQGEIDAFSRETERDREARRTKMGETLAREGYVYDPGSDTWVLDRSASVDGRDNQGFDESGYDRAGYDRDGFNASGFNREGYGRNGFNRQGVNADGERIEDVRGGLQARQGAREDSSTGWTPWLSGYAEGWAEGVAKDVRDLPQVAADAAAAVADGTVEVLRAATDPENWRVVGETLTGTGHDIFVDPAAGASKAWQSSKDAGGAAAQLASAVAQNPVLVAKAVIGLDNWEKAVDPKVPLGERIAAVLMGTVDIGMNLAGAGAAKAAAKVDDLVDTARAAKAADAAADASRTAKAADKAVDAERSADAAAEAAKAKKEFEKYKKDVAASSATRAEHGTVVRQEVGINDYKPAIDPGTGLPVQPDVRGMPPKNVRHAQVVADKYGVKIQVRPTNKDARELLQPSNGGRPLALPKPEMIKAKTVTDLDIALGAPKGSNGKVAVFWPKDPPGVAQGMVKDRNAFKAWTESNPALSKRWEQRMKEFGNEMSDMQKLAAEGKITWDPRNPVILDTKTGLPFAGDHDVFDVRGINGERVSSSVRAQIMKELEGPPYRNQHNAHMDWDYTNKPHFEKNKAIDERILAGHTEGADNAEALVSVTADAPPTASWFTLGRRK